MPKGLLSTLKFIIGWPLSVIAIVFIFKVIFSNSASIKSIDVVNFPLLLISVICFLVYFFARSILWHQIIKEKGNKFPYKQTIYFWQIAEIKRYIPGNIWSFVSRADLFSKNNIDKKSVATSLVTEAILLVISCFAVSSFYISSFLNNALLSNLITILNILIFLGFVFLGREGKRIIFEKKYFKKIKLYLISIFAFFMFGLATYFSAISIFSLDLKNISLFISLFVFSFLTGYLSFITPMGLGVREAAVTFGLSKYVSVSTAGIVSVFTRIILIISELLFLVIVFLWFKAKHSAFEKVENFIVKNKHLVVLSLCILIYIFYFTTVSFLRYDNFYTGRFDLGNMDQTVWNTSHGRIFQLTDPDGTNNISRLSVHADFILILISPLYFIWSNPKMLLLLQTIILALGSIFVYLTAKEVIKNKNFSLMLSVLFLLNPAVMYTNLYDFHAITLATTFLLGAFYFLLKRKYFLFLLFAFLAGITKEEVWAIIALFGLSIIVRQLYEKRKIYDIKEFIFGSLIFVSCLSLFYLLVAKIIPLTRGGEHFAISYYSDFGTSAPDVIKNILLNPVKTMLTLFQEDNRGYLTELFGPLGFTSIAAFPFLVFAIPDLSVNLLSSNAQLHQIYYQYSAAITPFIFIATIYGVRFIKSSIPNLSLGIIAIYLIASTLYFQYITGPLPGTIYPNIDMFTKPLVNKIAVDGFLTSIPKRYSIAATNNVGSHLSRRRNIYTIPNGLDKADIIVFLIDQGFSYQDIINEKGMINNLSKDKKYTLVFSDKDFYVFKKSNIVLKFRM